MGKENSQPPGAEPPRGAVHDAAGLAERLPVERDQVAAVAARFRLRIPEHYLSLIGAPGGPLWRQAVPSMGELDRELDREPLPADPLAEDDPAYSPVPHLTHRYPGRVLLLVTGRCAMYCRFCMRKRKTQEGSHITGSTVARGIDYIRQNSAVGEVILSGGDPLILSAGRLEAILGELRSIPHVEIIRIHTRMPCTDPLRITGELAGMLARYQPLFLGVHFNHPREVSPEAVAALGLLREAGLPLHNQSVLLKGVNDDPLVLAGLFRRLMAVGVHPYYLHHPDLVPGTAHFRLSIREGLEIVGRLRKLAPELDMLHYLLDTPGGGGKVPLEGSGP